MNPHHLRRQAVEEVQDSFLASRAPFPKASLHSAWCQGNEVTFWALSQESILLDVGNIYIGLGVK